MKKNVNLIKIVYFLILIFLCFTPFLPFQVWWLVTLFQLSPLWVLFVPLYLFYLFDGFRKVKGWTLLYLFFSLLIFVFIMGFEVNVSSYGSKEKDLKSNHLRVVSINLGGGVDSQLLLHFLKDIKPDIIFLQEISSNLGRYLIENEEFEGWYKSFNSGLGIISSYKIKREDVKKREYDGGRGALVSKYDLEMPSGILPVVNLHLETIGEGLEALIAREANSIDLMKKVAMIQEVESSFSSNLANAYASSIVAGDFNMRDVNPVYRDDWSKYRNAFSEAGFGLGYTRYTSWHGVRIDHVLYDENWKTVKAFVGSALGGDHRPIVVDFEFIGNYSNTNSVIPREKQISLRNEYNLMLEEFESTPGEFVIFGNGKMSVDHGNTYLRGSSLKVQSVPASKQMTAAIKVDNWNLDSFSKVKFSYRLSEGVEVALRVKTQFNDLICLGGTNNAKCPDNKSKQQVDLFNDDQWHEIDIDARGMVRSLLSGIMRLQEFQIYMHENRNLGDHFWIDDFRVGN